MSLPKISKHKNSEYTVALICPLPEERLAAEMMLDGEDHGREQERASNDRNVYTLGKIQGHMVVIVGLPSGEKGMASTVTVAGELGSSFPNIRFGILVGIGGGIPGAQAENPVPDIRLGDVVVADPEGDLEGGPGIMQHDLGKMTDTGFVPIRVNYDNFPRILRSAVGKLKTCETAQLHDLYIEPKLRMRIQKTRNKFSRPAASTDILMMEGKEVVRAARQEPGQQIDLNPEIHFGTIASGSQVIGSEKDRDVIRARNSAVLCIEMEGAALLQCSYPYLVIRGVSDYCDSRKNDTWKYYAAIAAAACATKLLSFVHPQTVSSGFGEDVAQTG
ncbi:purine and uridine phosphorylase [Ascobolus immersus RN42]|uniref:Purine and uridine phosphorylase n=1 Tax=Ascobolus immersus RN42 TaxID=1160509 RepID=A0A3N4I6I4_ASCIM|nr:purine and uridine phosphorylase [Ascobolus immersus RN42]